MQPHCFNRLYLGLIGLRLRLRWVSKKSKDLILAVRPIYLGRGHEQRKYFEIDTPKFGNGTETNKEIKFGRQKDKCKRRKTLKDSYKDVT